MNIKDIFFSKNHLTNPFTIPAGAGNKSTQLTPMEKVTSVALSILIGMYTAGIGGIIAFYLITSTMKATKLNHQQPFSETVRHISKQEHNNTPFIRTKTQVVECDKILARVSDPSMDRLFVALSSSYDSKSNSPYPTSIQSRKFPPLSAVDTITFKNGRFRSVHPEGVKFYRDNEILILHPSTREINLGSNIKAHLTDNGKVVIQQQAARGCTAAAVAMLVHDARKSINLNSLRSTNLGNTDDIKHWITKAGLTPQVTTLSLKDAPDDLMHSLQKLIHDYGSAIISTDNDIGGHVIVVDTVSIDLSFIRLRDPYHGWAITVTREAFLRGFCDEDIIQIV
jgi:hypothetical protein